MENIELYNAMITLEREAIVFGEKSFRITVFENKEKTRLISIYAYGSFFASTANSNELWPHEINKIDLATLLDASFSLDENKTLLFTDLNSQLVLLGRRCLYLLDYKKVQLKVLAKTELSLHDKYSDEPLNGGRIQDTDNFVTANADGSLCFVTIENFKFKMITSEKKGIDYFQFNKSKLVAKDANHKLLAYDMNEINTKNYIPKALIYQSEHPVRSVYLSETTSYMLVKGDDFKIMLFRIEANQIRKVASLLLDTDIVEIILSERFLFMFKKDEGYLTDKKKKKIYCLAILDKQEAEDRVKEQQNLIQSM